MSGAELALLAFAAICLLGLLLVLLLWGGPPVCPHCGVPHPDSLDRIGGYQPCQHRDPLGGPPLFP